MEPGNVMVKMIVAITVMRSFVQVRLFTLNVCLAEACITNCVNILFLLNLFLKQILTF